MVSDSSVPLMRTRMLIYGLDLLDVGCLFDVNIVENAIDRLVMRPEENKATIKAIVKTYTDNDENGLFRADFIHGKGEGQIFLLHGPPGTGKTLTAGMNRHLSRRKKSLTFPQSLSQSTPGDHCSASLRLI